jgi:glutathione-regulated potassium-efflux system protein KefB
MTAVNVQQAAESSHDMILMVAVLAAGALSVPLFRRIGLGAVLGYLAAGLAVGPFGLRLVPDPEKMLHSSELGVVLFLFIIGLEMKPAKLWRLRSQILGLGVLQVVLCSAFLTGVGVMLGFPPAIAFVAGMGFVLTSTAIVMQMLQEEGEMTTSGGEKIVSVLLLEDLAIVPILAIVALLSPADADGDLVSRLFAIAIAAGVVTVFLLFGGKILNAFFRVVVLSGAREITTVAALVIVLGAAALLENTGLSMALGAFLAGVVLSTSNFRHQLEQDITPFRDLLMGMFFLAVGMSLDVEIVAKHWMFLLACVVSFMAVKSVVIYLIARALRSNRVEALKRSVMMAQGGEFAFVLFTTATTSNLMDSDTNAMLTAVVILSMALTPISIFALNRFLTWNTKLVAESAEADSGAAAVMILGFGRFGQIVVQPFLAANQRVIVVEKNEELAAEAEKYALVNSFHGDACDPVVLAAAGLTNIRLILVCTDNAAETTKIVGYLRRRMPETKIIVRAYDEDHALSLARSGVEHHVQELFESALSFSEKAAEEAGISREKSEQFFEAFRKRDADHFQMQLSSGIQSSGDLLLNTQTMLAGEPAAAVAGK